MSSSAESQIDSHADATVAEWLDRVLLTCVARDASDVHLGPSLAPYYRTEGVLAPDSACPPIGSRQLEEVAAHLCRASHRQTLDGPGSVDGAVNASDGTRFRFNVFRRGGELAIALRKLEDRFRSLTELGLPESLGELADLPDGLVIVAGPTGAGKSTTLATLLDRVNRTRQGHIVTIEDPVEYIHRPQQCLVNQRQVGVDTRDFQEALVASLRQDPDIILVGEIREIETIRTAITAAETGHLVLTTVHAGDCVGVIERLVSVFPAEEQPGVRRQLALVLKAVICQHLLLSDGAGGRRASAEPPARKRVAVSEVLRVIPAVANLVATGKSNQIYSAMESGQALGMQTLEQDLARLLVSGRISEATARAYARNPGILQDRAARLRSGGGRAGYREVPR